MGEVVMEALFLRVLTVSAVLSLLLLPLLAGQRWLDRKYAPRTRWGLWLALSLVLLLAPWLPKTQAPVVVEAPAYTVTLPVRGPSTPILPVGNEVRPEAEWQERPEAVGGGENQNQPGAPAQSVVRPQVPAPSGPDAAAEVPQAEEPQAAGLSLTALAAGAWLLGMAVILLWQGGRYLLVRRRLLGLSRPASGLEPYAAELGLEGKVTFLCCEAVPGPMTLGVLHPVVLLPGEGAAPAALRHELCHVKRHDVAYKLLVLLACALHWFNPLVWFLYRWADRDVEACCDAAVVAGQDNGYRRSYGELLLSAAEGGKNLPFTTSFGGGKEQMKARLTQLFRPGKQSRALVCVLLALALALSGLVACREKGKLADGVYCSPYANVVWPVGEQDAEGEDYGSIRLSLLEYDEAKGPHGKPLGEYTLPLSKDLTLRQLWWEEDRSAGEKGTEEWRKAVFELLQWPVYRDSMPIGTDYLIAEVENGQVVRLSWAMVDRDGTLYTNITYRFTLQLPESWAGNYTVEDRGTEVYFRYQENDRPLMTLHIRPEADDREGWEIMGIYRWYVYGEIPTGEEDTPWGGLREDLRKQLEGDSGFAWMGVGLSPEDGYTDAHYGFYLRLPRSWAGRYTVEQGSDEYGLFWRFWQKAGDGTRSGELFTIDLQTLPKEEEAPQPDAAKGRGVLGVRDWGDYWEIYRMTSPTWTSEQQAGYEEMQRDVQNITPADFGFLTGTPELQPLTENTMPTLVYYDPDRDFLLYRTVDTAYFHYGDAVKEFHAGQNGEKRVLWRCDVSEDGKTVYLCHVRDDGTGRDEQNYTWDIEGRTLAAVDAIPDGVDNMVHPSPEKLFSSGFQSGSLLYSNALETAGGTLAALTIDPTVGEGTLPYLCLTWMEEGQELHSKFLTPERIPAPQTYTDPDWGFTLRLPESMAGQYYVQKGGNSWMFYDKEQFGGSGGFLMGLWAEDAMTFRRREDRGRVLGEKGNILFSLSVWPEEETEDVPQERREAYTAMIQDISREVYASSLDLSGVSRSSGYLWPFPYADGGNIVILRSFEEGHEHVDILAPSGGSVQSMEAGVVTSVHQNRVSGRYEVTVAHDDILSSYYGNLDTSLVEKGDQIERGAVLGLVGELDGRWVLQFARMIDGATYQDPLEGDYRLWDFTSLDRERMAVAGDEKIPAALWAVLRGEATFYNVEDLEYQYADALPYSDGAAVKVYRFTELDMDGDTIPEMVLWLQRGEDPYQLGSIVLRYQNGWVYGYPMGYRSMILETLKGDGSFEWANSAFEWGTGRMDFASGGVEKLTWRENQGNQWEKYYVSGDPVSQEAYGRAAEEQEAKENAVWYSLSETNPGRVERMSAVEKGWLDVVKPEQEELKRLVELSSHPSLDMENLRFFSAEELTQLEYGNRDVFGRPITYEEGAEFAPIQGAPDSPEAFRKRLEEQFTPELAEEEYHFALELGRSSACLFADGKMWHRVTGWNADGWWDYDWSTFRVVDAGEDFVSYQLSGYSSFEDKLLTRNFTLQLEQDGGKRLWKYSER